MEALPIEMPFEAIAWPQRPLSSSIGLTPPNGLMRPQLTPRHLVPFAGEERGPFRAEEHGTPSFFMVFHGFFRRCSTRNAHFLMVSHRFLIKVPHTFHVSAFHRSLARFRGALYH